MCGRWALIPAAMFGLTTTWSPASTARLIAAKDGTYTIEDLGSANGTYVNKQKITRTKIGPQDQILIAGEVVMPWPVPSLAKKIVNIGYDLTNDYRIDEDVVSGRHAKLIVDPMID